jgi:small-conductance mechanosensitive channel
VVTGLRYGMGRVNLDAHIRSTDIGRQIERSGSTLTNIVLTAVKWLLIFVVAVYAISALQIPPLTASMLGILAWIPNLAAVVLIVFIGALVASYVGRLLENGLPRYGVTGGRIIGVGVELLILALVFNFALIQLGFAQGIVFVMATALSWGLAAALAIGIGVPIALSLRGVLSPMFLGATSLAGALRKGQQVSIQGIPNIGDANGGKLSGRVTAVGAFSTIIARSDGNGRGEFVVLPNHLRMDKPIVIESGETPKLMETVVSQRMSDLNERAQTNQGT